MVQLIDKAAVVEEIEKRISRNKERKEWEDIPEKRHQLIIEGQLLGELKHFLDTIEVKGVDLEKEIEKSLKRYSMLAVDKKDFTEIAKYFFELGLKAQKGE